jgi:hypothetical protein
MCSRVLNCLVFMHSKTYCGVATLAKILIAVADWAVVGSECESVALVL